MHYSIKTENTIELTIIYDHLDSDTRFGSVLYMTSIMSEEEIRRLMEHCQGLLEDPEYRKSFLDSVKQTKQKNEKA